MVVIESVNGRHTAMQHMLQGAHTPCPPGPHLLCSLSQPSLPSKQQGVDEEGGDEEDDEMVVMESVNGRHTAMQHMLQGAHTPCPPGPHLLCSLSQPSLPSKQQGVDEVGGDEEDDEMVVMESVNGRHTTMQHMLQGAHTPCPPGPHLLCSLSQPSLPSKQQGVDEVGGDEEDDEMVVMESVNGRHTAMQHMLQGAHTPCPPGPHLLCSLSQPSLPSKQQGVDEVGGDEEDDEMVVMESVNGRHTAMQHMLQGAHTPCPPGPHLLCSLSQPSLPSKQQGVDEVGGDEEDDEMVVMESVNGRHTAMQHMLQGAHTPCPPGPHLLCSLSQPSLPSKQQGVDEVGGDEEDDEMVVMESVNGRHMAMQHMLQGRLSAVRHVVTLWVDGALLLALSALAASKDLAVRGPSERSCPCYVSC
ncbi:unnamed protein product [Closterium sp. NIES-65]|nr:unnamed protein product [Closterium sp. NIES-65]